MGICGLSTYIKHNNIFEEIEDIRNVIKEYRKKLNIKPTIIFDINGLVYRQCCFIRGALGCNHPFLLREYETFFDGLKTVGANLVFFSDGRVQNDKCEWWCKKQDNHYKAVQFILSKNIIYNDARTIKKYLRFKCLILLQSVIQMIKHKNFGEVYVSMEVECDRSIAKHALDSKALAVVSDDTDFLIFCGDFQIWNSSSLILSKYSVEHIDREKLSDNLRLNRDQMKKFATIAGNDFTKPFINDRIMDSNFKGPTIETIADYSRTESNIKATYRILSSLQSAWKIGVKLKVGLKAISKSNKFYDIQDVASPRPISDFNGLVYSFEHDLYFPYEVNFFDFKVRVEHTNKSLIDFVMEVFQKIGGLILPCDESKRLQILTKFSHDKKYAKYELIPNFDFGVSTDDSNLNKVVRCLGLDLAIVPDLDKILSKREILLLPILSILFLTKAKEMNRQQASAMLIVHCTAQKECFIKHLRKSDFEIIRTAQIFLKIGSLVSNCLYVCGLKELLENYISSYDCIYYSKKLLLNKDFTGDKGRDFDAERVKGVLNEYLLAEDEEIVEIYHRLLIKY